MIIFGKNLVSYLRQIHGNALRETSNEMVSVQQNRLFFTLQSGGPATMIKHNVLRAFLHFSEVGYLFYKISFTCGWDYTNASNLLLPITTSTDVWELHSCKN